MENDETLKDGAGRPGTDRTDRDVEVVGGAETANLESTDAVTMRKAEATAIVPDGSTGEPEQAPTVLEASGRYHVRGETGRGGMGRILVVSDAFMGRDIALKELLPFPSAEGSPTPVRKLSSIAGRFLQEARIAGQLEHPSIVPVYEIGRRDDGSYYYTMKLVRGRTLAMELAASGSLSDRLRFLSHFRDLCNAIAYAHDRGVIHRDLKPSNVMVGPFGETVVIDWGLAKAKGQPDTSEGKLEESVRELRLPKQDPELETVEGSALGTPAYMPPEQAKGEVRQIDERSDVYSLGAVLYEILTGRAPFRGSTAWDVLARVIVGEYPRVRTLESRAPAELVAICERAMKLDPAERYQSAKELAEEIDRFPISGALVGAYAYRPHERFLRFAARHKATLSISAAALAICLTLAIVSFVRISRARNEAEAELYRMAITAAHNQIEAGEETAAFATLLAAPGKFRNWEWGHLLLRSSRDVMKIPIPGRGNEPDFPMLVFSADGSTLLGYSSNFWDSRLGSSRIMQWDVKSGELRAQKQSQDAVLQVAARPDGDWIAISQSVEGKQFQVSNLSTGKAVSIGTQEGDVSWDLSADGSTALLRKGLEHNAAELRFVETRTGKDIAVRTTRPCLKYPRFGLSRDGSLLAVACERTIEVIRVADWQTVGRVDDRQAKEASDVLNSISIGQGGRQLVTASAGGEVRLWDLDSGTSKAVTGAVGTWASLSPSGRYLLVGQILREGTSLFDLATPGSSGAVRFSGGSCAFSPDERLVACVVRNVGETDTSSVAFFPLPVLSPDRMVLGPESGANCAALSADGSRVATGDRCGQVQLWDTTSGLQTGSIDLTNESGVGSIAGLMKFSRDGKHLAIAENDGSVDVYSVPGLSREAVLSEPYANVDGLEFSPDARTLAIVGSEGHTDNRGSGRIWEWASGRIVGTFRGIESPVGRSTPKRALFSNDGSTLYVSDDKLRVWAIPVRRIEDQPEEFFSRSELSDPGFPESLVLSADGLVLACPTARGDVVGPINAWSTTDRSAIATFPKARGTFALTPDGSRLISVRGAALGGALELTDTATSRPVLGLGDLRGPRLTSLEMSDDGGTLLSFSKNLAQIYGKTGTVELWFAWPYDDNAYLANGAKTLAEGIEQYKREYWKKRLVAANQQTGVQRARR